MKKKESVTPKEMDKTKWYLIDASDMQLGKLAVKAAGVLIGKKKVTYVPNLFSGDNLVIVNAEKIKVPDKRRENKMYYKHSGYPGGLKSLSMGEFMQKNPAKLVETAIKGMVPKTKLGKVMLTHLYIYNTATNPHEAQKPVTL